MNMILHNVPDAHIENEDTLTAPNFQENGYIRRFDRVLANPPFFQNYTKVNMEFPERFKYGFTPETGKKADLMFLQHMITYLKDDGMMASVMPHGVLFRKYLNTEKKELTKIFENLWDKYKVSLNELKFERDLEVKKLEEFLEKLGYLKNG
jgi:type I restriction-modification system DNA methylase subunit